MCILTLNQDDKTLVTDWNTLKIKYSIILDWQNRQTPHDQAINWTWKVWKIKTFKREWFKNGSKHYKF